MSWEIQGRVRNAADVDRLVAAPTEKPTDTEAEQVAAVVVALKGLLDAGVVGGGVYVRAGGHSNGGGPAEGQPHEMVTLTIDYLPVDEESPSEDPAVAGAEAVDVATTAEAPTQGAEPPAEG